MIYVPNVKKDVMDAEFACNKKTQLLRFNQPQAPEVRRVEKKGVVCRTMTLN